MSIKKDIRLVEGKTSGVKVICRDVNSDVVVPTSMNYLLRDSFNTVVTTGSPSALSSETNITFTNSEIRVNSGEVKEELVRTLDVEWRYTSTVFGANAVGKETFELTLVNNPY